MNVTFSATVYPLRAFPELAWGQESQDQENTRLALVLWPSPGSKTLQWQRCARGPRQAFVEAALQCFDELYY